MMRTALDWIYRSALWLSALCIVAIAVIVGLQLFGRIVDKVLELLGLPAYGFVILSEAEIAGYLLAAASFLALAGTLKANAHIRVAMLLTTLGEGARRWAEMWALGFSFAFSAFMTWHIGTFAYYSWKFNEVSPGLVAVPLVYPQAAMTGGALLLAVAFAEELLTVMRGGRPSIHESNEVHALSKDIEA
jgi:TRAP-type C4-dicarboxylate transport system permease small subunit